MDIMLMEERGDATPADGKTLSLRCQCRVVVYRVEVYIAAGMV